MKTKRVRSDGEATVALPEGRPAQIDENRRLSRRSLLAKGATASAAALGAVALAGTRAEAVSQNLVTEKDTAANAATFLHAADPLAGAYNGSVVFATYAPVAAGENITGLQGTGSGTGAGVVGISNSSGSGVAGTSFTGAGVQGAGSPGVQGTGLTFQFAGRDGVVAIGGNASLSGYAGAGLRALGGTSPDTHGPWDGHGVVATGGPNGGVGGVLSGGRAAAQLVATSTAGPPTAGGHQLGDLLVDARGVLWLCAVAGTPGTFVPMQTGGWGKSHFTAVATSQYTLNSDGVTWKDVDATNISLTITPLFNCQAILSANADLWTTIPGFNQDIGVAISGGTYPTVAGQPEAWKESGGFAGTFSPNAAFLETTKRLLAGTTYTIKLVWKSNRTMPASGPQGAPSLIVAGAGPIPAGSSTFSPTRLGAQLIVDV